MSVDYYDRQGRPLTMQEWVMLYEDRAYRHVDQTTIGEVMISTVWLGLNHAWGDGPPMIFETMVFGGQLTDMMWRYSTEAEAKAGHDDAVVLVLAELELSKPPTTQGD